MLQKIELVNKCGSRLELTNYGATIMNFFLLDKHNEMVNVVVGLENADDYKNALDDINKALSLKKEPIYTEFLEKLKALVEKRKKDEIEQITSNIEKI